MFVEEENTFDAFNNALNNPRKAQRMVRNDEDMSKTNMYIYIAQQKPLDAHLLINQYGKYRRARGVRELESQIKHFVRQNGSIALKELAKIHPDRDLILEEAKETNSELINNKNNYSNVDGQTSSNPTSNISSSQKEDIGYSKMLIWGSFVLLGIAIIMKKQ